MWHIALIGSTAQGTHMRKKPSRDAAERRRVKALSDTVEAVSKAVKLLEELDAVELEEALQVPNTLLLPDLNNSVNFYQEVARFKIRLIRLALELTHGHQTKSATLLGLKGPTLSELIKRHRVDWRHWKHLSEQIDPIVTTPFTQGD
jgi:transcriptional regulator with GAF, ATPase, and Fis domain